MVEKAGMYDLNICYATDGGAKTQKLNVNGNAAGDLALSNHTDFSESNVARIKLNAGENELEFVSYWGWTQFDYLTLTEPVYPELSATSDPGRQECNTGNTVPDELSGKCLRRTHHLWSAGNL